MAERLPGDLMGRTLAGFRASSFSTELPILDVCSSTAVRSKPDDVYSLRAVLLYVGQAEWRVIWEQCLRADGQRIVDIKVTENLGEVAKYATEPDAYLKLDGEECAIRSGIKRRNSRSAAVG